MTSSCTGTETFLPTGSCGHNPAFVTVNFGSSATAITAGEKFAGGAPASPQRNVAGPKGNENALRHGQSVAVEVLGGHR